MTFERSGDLRDGELLGMGPKPKPLTSFMVEDGRVVRAFVVAFAD